MTACDILGISAFHHDSPACLVHDGVIVIRKGEDNRPVPIPVDLRTAIDGNGGEGEIPPQPHDVVYVPKTWIAKAT